MEQIVSGSKDKTIRIWNLVSLDCVHVFNGHSRPVTSLAVLDKTHLVSTSFDKTCRVWQIDSVSIGEDGKGCENAESILRGHKDGIECCCVLPDGRIVTGSWDHSLNVYDARRSQEYRLGGHTGVVNSVSCIPSARNSPTGGNIVSVGEDRRLIFWSP